MLAPGSNSPVLLQLSDASTKVDLAILQRVYQNMMEKSERAENGQDELLDPEEHLYFIDAYEMPRLCWSQTRSTFEKYAKPFASLFMLTSA